MCVCVPSLWDVHCFREELEYDLEQNVEHLFISFIFLGIGTVMRLNDIFSMN